MSHSNSKSIIEEDTSLKLDEESLTNHENNLKNKERARIQDFQNLLLLESSSDESEKKYDDDDDIRSHGNSDKATSPVVGTSKNSSNSFRNYKKLAASPILSENIYRKSRKEKKERKDEAIEEEDIQSCSIHTESYDIDQLNMAETLALFESEDENLGEEDVEDESKNVLKDIEVRSKKLKQAVITILLSNKWQQNKKKSEKNKKKSIMYQPTFRLEPKENVKKYKFAIMKKISQTFENLVEKHVSYNQEYTPKFIRIITEMIKNDAKSFKLDRYKIVVHTTILQKIFEQCVQFISRELFSIDDDEKFSFCIDTKSFNVVCLVFFVYHE